MPLQPWGTSPPFFCVHGVGGNEVCFHDLARQSPPTQPVHALTAVGRPLGPRAPLRIEDMAAGYLKAIRQLQPAGPYHLGGFSFGGSVAFEMAQQLLAQGEQVGLLVILDHTPPPLRYRRIVWRWRTPFDLARNVFRWVMDEIVHVDGRKRGALVRSLVQRAAKRLWPLLQPGPDTGRTDVDAIFAAHRLPDEMRRVMEEHYQALRDYQPRRYSGRVTLVRARTRPLLQEHGPDLGWREFAQGGLEVVNVPGNHETILRDPNVRLVASEALRRLPRNP